MTNEMVVIDQNMLMCVAGGDGDYNWEDIGIRDGGLNLNLGQLNDLGSDLGCWLYDFFNS
jgi:hypothetical protein